MWYAVVIKSTFGNEFVADFDNKYEAEKCANQLGEKYNKKYDVVEHFFKHK